jgi:hypothetical protein
MHKARILIILLLSICLNEGFCEENPNGASEAESDKELKGIRKFADKMLNPDPNNNLRILPMPAASYDPANGFSAGAYVDLFFRIKADSLTPLSYVSIPFYMATNGKVVAGASADLYFGSKHRMKTFYQYSKSPTPFYGIGNQTPLGPAEEYQHIFTKFGVSYTRRVAPGLFLGGNYFFQTSLDIDVESGGNLYFSDASGKQGYTMSGPGLSMQYDTRDLNTSPYSGTNLNINTTFYTPFFGSDNYTTEITFTAANYFQPGQKSHILATRVGFDIFTREPPFQMMHTLGNDVLRGYREGHYLSTNRWFAQAEYRFPIVWRFRGVAFASVGDVARKVDYFSLNSIKLSGGAGFRFVVDPKERLSLRFDYGFALDGSRGFYFSINEAF